jgi:DNA-binding NarL/FixJ family response regulator
MFLVDAEGQEVIRPSAANDLALMVRQEGYPPPELVRKVVQISVFDTLPGVKVIISPIKVMGSIRFYCWAGVLLEEESCSLLFGFLESNMDSPSMWKRALLELPITPGEEKQRLIEELQILSESIGTLLEFEENRNKGQHIIERILRVSEMRGPQIDFVRIIQEILRINGDLDFVGFATKTNGGCVISHMIGGSPYDNLLGSSFSSGEGFLGHVVVTETDGCWNKVEHDPRNAFFINKNIRPLSIFAYPVKKSADLYGVVFGGSCRKDFIHPNMLDVGKVFTNILEVHLSVKELSENTNYQIQQLNTLMEICHLIVKVSDINKIAYFLVDMSMNLLHARFAAITIFDLDSSPDEIRIVARGISTEQSEKYAKGILQTYRETYNNSNRDHQFAASTHHKEWGDIFEAPMMNRKLHGVLSVSLDSGKDEQQKAFISTLATIGGIAIQQTSQSQSGLDQSVVLLHEAMGQWNREGYEFTQRLKEWSVSFSEYFGIQQVERNEIEFACLLSEYSLSFLRGHLQQQQGVLKIIEDYVVLSQNDTKKMMTQNMSLGGQILAVAASYLKNKGRLINSNPSLIESDILEKFESFILQKQTIDRKISIKKEQVHIEGLSNREQEVLHLMVEGMNNKQIAIKLFISEHTVKNHISNIFSKLGVNDRAGLMAYFYNQKMEKQ